MRYINLNYVVKMSEIKLYIPKNMMLPEIYKLTTPDENFLILHAGDLILHNIRNSNYNIIIEDLKTKLEDEKALVKNLKHTIMSSTSNIACAVESVLNDGLHVMETSLEEKIRKLMTNDYSNEIKKLEEKLILLTEYMERLKETSKLFDVKDKNSSIRGRDNEIISKQLTLDNFAGPGTDFNLEQKEYYAGDHIFNWCGLKIMWEDKNYEKIVPKDQIEKAYRDFDLHKNCHVLLFISANSAIRDHETSSGLDVDIHDGRLVLFISYFRSHPDPNAYIRNVIQPIIIGYKPFLIDAGCFIDSTLAIKLKTVSTILPTIVKEFNDREKEIDETIAKLAIMKTKLAGSRGCLEELFETVTKNIEPAAAKAARTCGICGETGHTRKKCHNAEHLVINLAAKK